MSLLLLRHLRRRRRERDAIRRTEALERWHETWNDEYARSGDPVAACKAADAARGLVQLKNAAESMNQLQLVITENFTGSRSARTVVLPKGATVHHLTSPEIREMADTVAEARKTIAELQKKLEAKTEQLRRIDREGMRFAIATDHVEVMNMGSRHATPIPTAHIEVLVTRDEIESLARQKAYHQTHAMPLMAIHSPGHEPDGPFAKCSCRACEAMRDFNLHRQHWEIRGP